MMSECNMVIHSGKTSSYNLPRKNPVLYQFEHEILASSNLYGPIDCSGDEKFGGCIAVEGLR